MFRTILFDIDGVMLSEEHYFDASALTVYELLHSPSYLGTSPSSVGLPEFQPKFDSDTIRRIRNTVFANDHVLHVMKSAGINANWDMVFLQSAYQTTRLLEWIRERKVATDLKTIQQVVEEHGWGRHALEEIGRTISEGVPDQIVHYAAFTESMESCKTKQELFDRLNQRLLTVFGTNAIKPFTWKNQFWNLCRDVFQEWYLGDKHHPDAVSTGKVGFLENEDALVNPDALQSLFLTCIRQGIDIGIATGRPGIETRVPLTSLGWLSSFEPSRVSTADDVLQAERTVPERAPLSKPNPYSYLRSYLKSPDVKTVLDKKLPLPEEEGHQILVVGDSVADLLAAKALGCKFAGVLTGLAGAAARSEFEALGADYVFENVLSVREVIS